MNIKALISHSSDHSTNYIITINLCNWLKFCSCFTVEIRSK